MNKKDIQFKKISDSPGVYLFRNAKKRILYIGKATSLRSRVRSYFNTATATTRGAIIVKMLEEASTVEVQKTDSVLEALILEAYLIKKNQPVANSREKDNKSFNYVIITKEEFPRVLVVRGRELFSIWNQDKTNAETKYVFGPFPNSGVLKDGLKIIRKIFPFRDTCTPCPRGALGHGVQMYKRNSSQKEIEKKKPVCKPCFNRQIGLCPGVCIGTISKTKYNKTIRHIALLFEGKKKTLLKQLIKEMKQLSAKQQFEEAQVLKKQINSLTHIQETALLGSDYKVSDGSDSSRIEAYDVAHISETARVGVMVVINESTMQKKDYRKFIIRTKKKGDIAALEEIMRRRFEHPEWKLPALLVIDGSTAQKNAVVRVSNEYGYKIPIINVVKNDTHTVERIVGNPILIEKYEKEILLANSEAHRCAIKFHRAVRQKALIA